MAAHNVPGVPLCRADALHSVSRDAVVLLDPARRSAGRRRFDPRAYAPPLDELIQAYRGRAVVVKCAQESTSMRCGGWVSMVDRGDLTGRLGPRGLPVVGWAHFGVRRRATVLDRAEVLTDTDPDECAVGAPGRWIVDPDGAVVRAGLVRQYATRHGLWQIDPDIAYLTGDRVPDGVRGFEILDRIPLRERLCARRFQRARPWCAGGIGARSRRRPRRLAPPIAPGGW